MKKLKKYLLIILALILVLGYYFSREHNANDESFRNITNLVFTKHAKCRMGCREINEREIREIIVHGKVNSQKSGYDKKHDDETLVLEGSSYQNQHIRVVLTPENDRLIIITVIDLDKDWACDCS